jgi:hypothetical protein
MEGWNGKRNGVFPEIILPEISLQVDIWNNEYVIG